jgi:hypothetical protein
MLSFSKSSLNAFWNMLLLDFFSVSRGYEEQRVVHFDLQRLQLPFEDPGVHELHHQVEKALAE